MPVEFSCDGCNRRLRAPDAKAGKRTNCPTCGKELQIPVMSVGPQISLPAAAGAPAPHPLDKLAAAIPTASEAAGFNLSRPGTGQTVASPQSPAPLMPPTPSAKPDFFPRPSAQPIEIGLADEAPVTPASTSPSNASNSGSTSSSGIGGSLKPKPNAWRGGEKMPPMPSAAPKPAMPNLTLPTAVPRPAVPTSPLSLSLPMATAAPGSPLVPVAPVAPTAPVVANPLDEIFKDIPQLAPVGASAPMPNNAPMFGGLKPVTAADPFQSQGAALPTAAAPRWDQIASTANVGSSNPYAAPSMSSSTGYRRGADIESVRTIVMIPGVLLLISYILMFLLYGVQLGIYVIGGFALYSSNAISVEEDASIKHATQLGAAIVVFILSIAGIFGAIKMIRLRSWSAALTASIMAIFPFYFCLPLGIWAVIVLSMENVRNAFEANDRRAERRA